MELRHLRYFAALAAELSFTRAAEKVHVTQSTLSHQIRQLEDEIGQRLFDRIGRRVIMTEAGETLLTHVTKALREIDDGIREVKEGHDDASGLIRIGTTHTFNLSLIPTCLATFLARHPAMRVVVKELLAVQVEAELVAGTIDIGIGYDPSNSRACAFEPLYTEEMVLAVAPTHPFAGRKRIRLVELHRHRLVVATGETVTRGIIEAAFRSVGAAPTIVAEMDSVAAMLELASRTDIGAIVSRLGTAGARDVRIVALESPTPLRAPGILMQNDTPRSPALLSFIGIVRRAVLERK